MTDTQSELGGADRVPDDRLDEQGQATGAECRECGTELMAGYLCDDCDTVEVLG